MDIRDGPPVFVFFTGVEAVLDVTLVLAALATMAAPVSLVALVALARLAALAELAAALASHATLAGAAAHFAAFGARLRRAVRLPSYEWSGWGWGDRRLASKPHIGDGATATTHAAPARTCTHAHCSRRHLGTMQGEWRAHPAGHEY